jgi:hypothetical protein
VARQVTDLDLGDLVNKLGVQSGLDESALVTDVVVLLKYVDAEGGVGLRMAFGEGMSWIERLGMIRAAEDVELADLRAANGRGEGGPGG